MRAVNSIDRFALPGRIKGAEGEDRDGDNVARFSKRGHWG
jgi:hypothetical protein